MKVFKSLLAAGTLATALVGAPTAHVQAQVPINGLVSGVDQRCRGGRPSEQLGRHERRRAVRRVRLHLREPRPWTPHASTGRSFCVTLETRETTLVSIDSAGNAGDSQSRSRRSAATAAT